MSGAPLLPVVNDKYRERRVERLRRFGALYKAVNVPDDRCIYCGSSAGGVYLDHVPPLYVVEYSGDAERFCCVTVPACKLCNQGLGALAIPLLRDRQRYLAANAFMRKWLLVDGYGELSARYLELVATGFNNAVEFQAHNVAVALFGAPVEPFQTLVWHGKQRDGLNALWCLPGPGVIWLAVGPNVNVAENTCAFALDYGCAIKFGKWLNGSAEEPRGIYQLVERELDGSSALFRDVLSDGAGVVRWSGAGAGKMICEMLPADQFDARPYR